MICDTCDVSLVSSRSGNASYGPTTIAIRVRFEHDTTSYEEPTISYALSSNNEHVNSFALLYGVVANQRVGGGASAMT